jgi:hypothetical protein
MRNITFEEYMKLPLGDHKLYFVEKFDDVRVGKEFLIHKRENNLFFIFDGVSMYFWRFGFNEPSPADGATEFTEKDYLNLECNKPITLVVNRSSMTNDSVGSCNSDNLFRGEVLSVYKRKTTSPDDRLYSHQKSSGFRFSHFSYPKNLKPKASPIITNNSDDAEELKYRKILTSFADPRICPCGGIRGVCQFH